MFTRTAGAPEVEQIDATQSSTAAGVGDVGGEPGGGAAGLGDGRDGVVGRREVDRGHDEAVGGEALGVGAADAGGGAGDDRHARGMAHGSLLERLRFGEGGRSARVVTSSDR